MLTLHGESGGAARVPGDDAVDGLVGAVDVPDRQSMYATLDVQIQPLTAPQRLVVLVPRDRDVGATQLGLERRAAWKSRHSDVTQFTRDRQ